MASVVTHFANGIVCREQFHSESMKFHAKFPSSKSFVPSFTVRWALLVRGFSPLSLFVSRCTCLVYLSRKLSSLN